MAHSRKNYLPATSLALLLWGLLTALIIWVEPDLVKNVLLPGVYLPFFALFFPASWLTLSLISADTTRGLILAGGLNTFLFLRIINYGNWLNLLLILGIAVALDRLRSH